MPNWNAQACSAAMMAFAAAGAVWMAWTELAWVGNRHGIVTREARFSMTSPVPASIASSVAAH